MTHKVESRPLRRWLIRSDALVTAKDEIAVDIVRNEIESAVKSVDSKHVKTDDFAFIGVRTTRTKVD